MEIVLALGSALAYGVSDFIGGILTKRVHVFSVILLSQLISCGVILALLPFWEGSFSTEAVGWGVAAGVAGVSGAAFLYRGLAIGRMGVVAPITGVLAAVIPLSFGLATGERPGPIALTGVVVGLAAVILISRSTQATPAESKSDAAGVLEALGAGVGFGLFFILLERTPQDSGLWPLAGTRISMLIVIAFVALLAGAPMRPAANLGVSLLWLGIVNLGADLLYLLATRSGLLSIVAVLTSLYPAATVALARVVLNERMVRQQMIGVVGAGLSVTLIALR
jgi:drug/metabolite transporter (DMT)-like permease